MVSGAVRSGRRSARSPRLAVAAVAICPGLFRAGADGVSVRRLIGFERTPGFGRMFPLVGLQTLPGAAVNASRAVDCASPVWR
jgi:hypothetical protein